jgi:hypothetical protein
MLASNRRRAAPCQPALLALAIALCTSVAARAADFQLTNVKLDFGALVVSAPTLEVKGSPLEREAFAALLRTGGESATSRLGKLTAAEITAPEIVFEQTLGGQKQITRYRNVRFSDLKEGLIGRGAAESATVSGTIPAQPGEPTPPRSAGGALGAATGAVGGGGTTTISGQMLRTSFEAFDARHLARVLTEKAQPGAGEPMRPIFGRFEQDGYTLDMGKAGKMSLGKSSGTGFAANVGPEPLGEVLSRLVALSDAAEKSAREAKPADKPLKTEDERRMGLALLSLYDSVSYGNGELRDLAMTLITPPTPGAKPETVEFKIARIAYGENAPAKSGFALEGTSFSGGGAKGQIETIAYSGFSLSPLIEELKALLAKPDADIDNLDFRKFIPTIGTIRMTGMSVDAPQPPRRGQPQPPLRIGLGLMELKTGEQLNGVPTAVSLTLDNLLVPVTEGPGNPAARDLIAMGFRTLDLSAKLDMAWDAAKSELGVRALSLGAANMAKLDISGILGNVTKDLFASDLALAQVAALGATVRSVEAKLQNFGLLEKLVENEARKANRKPDDMRREYAMMASLGLSAILGPSDAAKTLTAAISRFAAQPRALTVQASAKSGSGLGLADVLTITDPTQIFDKIDLKATAE